MSAVCMHVCARQSEATTIYKQKCFSCKDDEDLIACKTLSLNWNYHVMFESLRITKVLSNLLKSRVKLYDIAN